MNRHMRGIGNQAAIGIKQRAGKIQSLFDVDRTGGFLKRHAHLFCNRHKSGIEHFKQNRIGCAGMRRAGRNPLLASNMAG